jgi:hypothetical protein
MRKGKNDMKTSLVLKIMRGLLALLLLGFGGCSGGSGGSDSAGGGIGGSGVSVGAVTAIGSVVVNGVEFDTTNADVVIGGNIMGVGDQAVSQHLRVGMVVVVDGTVHNDDVTGTASTVYFDANVLGPVESPPQSIDPNTKEIDVLGQHVIIDRNTKFEDTTFDDVAEGNFVEVSGLVSIVGGEDAIRATYLRKTLPVTGVEVKGVVRDLNTSTQTFRIGNLTVQYSQTTELPDGEPAERLHVRVVGTVGQGGELNATKVEVAREARVGNANRMDVEGYVTEIVSPSEFTVGYQQVLTDDKTTVHGGGPANIAPGVKLEVKGKLENHILTAQKITFLD